MPSSTVAGASAAPALATFSLSAAAVALFSQPGVWGVGGAAVYAATQLLAVLYADGVPEKPQARRKAWAMFWVAIFFGGLAAQGFGPSLADHAGNLARPEAVWLIVGLSANAAWPAIERAGISALIRRIFGRSEETRS